MNRSPGALPSYILAGGRSSRFGSDKARALLGGVPMIVRVARMIAPVSASLSVVAERPGKFADLSLRTIADEIPEAGPIGGLYTALKDAAPSPWLLLVPCDAVTIQPEWIESLKAQAQPPNAAVAFFQDRWQPFPGLYHVALLAEIEQRIDRGRRSLWRLLDEISAAAVPLPSDWPAVFQINDRRQWRQVAGELPSDPGAQA